MRNIIADLRQKVSFKAEKKMFRRLVLKALADVPNKLNNVCRDITRSIRQTIQPAKTTIARSIALLSL